MSLTLIYLLLFLVLGATFLYLWFVRHRPHEDIGGRAIASLVIFVGILIPFTSFALFEQAMAKGRLEELGLTIYPGLGASVGIATGGMLSRGTWVFRLDDGNEPAFVEFYGQSANTGAWRASSDTPGTVLLTRGSERLLVTAHKDTGMFVLSARE